MANPTTNFGWVMPTSTDLVTDLPADFAVFGQSVDTSMADLKGGTTGQILSKNTNTDMDFVWISPQTGDITGVTAGTGISGGGTSGDVTITNSMATAIDAKGDLIAGTGADTFSRLAIGSNDQVLTADSTAATGMKWAAVSQKIVQIVYGSTTSGASSTSATWADTNLTATITPTSASNKVLVFVTQNGVCKSAANTDVGLRLSGGNASDKVFGYNVAATADTQQIFGLTCSLVWLDAPATTSATTYKTQFQNRQATGTVYVQQGNGSTSGILLVEVVA